MSQRVGDLSTAMAKVLPLQDPAVKVEVNSGLAERGHSVDGRGKKDVLSKAERGQKGVMTDDEDEEEEEETDVFKQTTDFGVDTGPPWSEQTHAQRLKKVMFLIARLVLVLGLLYVFICSLDVLQGAFQLLGGRDAGRTFQNSDILSNPVCGLMLGILVTVLVQSSSTSTSIVVSMVGANILPVRMSIPILFGSNIGTSVTNTIVSLIQSDDKNTFRRAFAGATVHDMFNWMAVLLFLPIEIASGMFYHLTRAMTANMQGTDLKEQKLLKVITEPTTNRIIQIDKDVMRYTATGDDRQKWPIHKFYCGQEPDLQRSFEYELGFFNQTLDDEVRAKTFTFDINWHNLTDRTIFNYTEKDPNGTRCWYHFHGCGVPEADTSCNIYEKPIGGILLVCSLIVLIGCLICLVKVLNSLMAGPMAKAIRNGINSEFPGAGKCFTGYVAMLAGAGITMLVQSSSVFTSALTPLVGMGIVTLERVYPLCLGSNVGTTITSILSALATSGESFRDALQCSFVHLFFNIFGILVFYPIPVMRKGPINLARILGNTTAEYRWFAVFYLLFMFFLLPGIVFGLSIAGAHVLIAVGVPLLMLVLVLIIINAAQRNCNEGLPPYIHDWEFLPRGLRSLGPIDHGITICCPGGRCRCCPPKKVEEKGEDDSVGRDGPESYTEEVLPISGKMQLSIGDNEYTTGNGRLPNGDTLNANGNAQVGNGGAVTTNGNLTQLNNALHVTRRDTSRGAGHTNEGADFGSVNLAGTESHVLSSAL